MAKNAHRREKKDRRATGKKARDESQEKGRKKQGCFLE